MTICVLAHRARGCWFRPRAALRRHPPSGEGRGVALGPGVRATARPPTRPRNQRSPQAIAEIVAELQALVAAQRNALWGSPGSSAGPEPEPDY
jgi:hypothetical protein